LKVKTPPSDPGKPLKKLFISRIGKVVSVTVTGSLLFWTLAFVPAVQNIPYWIVTGKTYEALEATAETDLGIPPLPEELKHVSGGRTHYVASYLATKRSGARTTLFVGEFKEHVQKLASNWAGMGGFVDEGDRLCNRLGVEVALEEERRERR
jgi:hypothetical protein